LIFVIGFGRGKPVQINPTYYKKPLRDELLTALAGPGMNILLAIGGVFLMMMYASIVGISQQQLIGYEFDLVTVFWFYFTTINLALAAFNLLPIFPLDGYRLVKVLWKQGAQWMERHGRIIAIVLLVLILVPGRGIIGDYISMVSDVLYRILFMLFSLVFY
jgi:Zn-dependent protease